MQKGTILSVDDDQNFQVVISQYLEDDGYKVLTASDVSSALEKAESAQPSVILLDLVLPDGEGLTLIPQFKSKASASSIIVVSGKSETTEKIVCLEMGADDYLTKPFEMRELAARIKAVTRRAIASSASANENNSKDKIYFNNGWCLDRSKYQLFDADGQSADLTTGEFKLLEALVQSPERTLSREHLFELTREGNYDVYDRAIDIQIARLRKKLKDDTKSPQTIKTVRGVGYLFSGAIEKH
jgi:two-component system phosphate regulon response regulator OmpR